MKKIILNQGGQLLIEILLAILIATMIMGAVYSLLYVNLKNNEFSTIKNTALHLAQEGLEAMYAVKDSSWHNIYLPPDGNGNTNNKGDSFPYYIYNDNFSWYLSTNNAYKDITANDKIYSRTIYIYNVNRDAAGDIVEIGGTEDPSTQKIKISVDKNGGHETILEEYITRWRNDTFIQTDWSGGSGQSGPLPIDVPTTQYFSDDGNIEISNPVGSIRLKQ